MFLFHISRDSLLAFRRKKGVVAVNTHMVLFLAFAQTWTMVAGGDIMLNGVAPSTKTFADFKSFVSLADFATANLEIPLTASRTPTKRKTPAELKARSQFILKADPRHASSIANAGFDVVGLGNNHAMDYGYAAMASMRATLSKLGVGTCGAGANYDEAASPATYIVKKSKSIAVLSFLAFKTPGGLWKCTPAGAKTPGVATVPPGKVASLVRSAKKSASFVLVWLHWGLERKTVPEAFQVKLGRSFIDAGADCVLGAHPHVLQGAEVYNGKPVFYSLGNLVSPLPSTTGLFRLNFNGNQFVSAEMAPASITGGAVRSVRSTRSYVNRFNSLSQAIGKLHKNKKSLPLLVTPAN